MFPDAEELVGQASFGAVPRHGSFLPALPSNVAGDLVRQLDSIRVLPFPFMLVGENLFEPVRLAGSYCLVHEGGIMKHNELLLATVTPKDALKVKSRSEVLQATLLGSPRYFLSFGIFPV